jgi:catechol 2,3-dioxygenase-like lactoylglutathione lyase family enzyme
MEERQMDLGEHYPCLNVQNLEKSIEFYLKLDFKLTEDHGSENWAVLQHNNMALCLYQAHIDENLINFRGGDIEAIHKEATARGLEFTKPASVHEDGSWSAELHDPDGNSIFFNTFPRERDEYARTGKLIDY